jgi:hypothetical protein
MYIAAYGAEHAGIDFYEGLLLVCMDARAELVIEFQHKPQGCKTQ